MRKSFSFPSSENVRNYYVAPRDAIENLCLVEQAIHNPFSHKGDDPKPNKMKTGEVHKIALTIPQSGVDIIAVVLSTQIFIDGNDTTKGRAA